MRFESLTLEKYGAVEALTLPLAGTGLTVVHGPNEAGKSTCLSALGDFLFGIPDRTAMGVFGYDQMRIGASLTLADGRRLDLRRRKGRAGRTLTDASGAAVEEAVLGGPLGSTDRTRFDRLFGLDHQSLRLGGEQLLAADGEIGRLIVEAGGGLADLVRRLERIDAEADALFAPRRSASRAFYVALDDFGAAETRQRAATLSRDTWEAARKACDAAHADLGRLRAERSAMATERSRLDRLVRVAPLLSRLATLEASLAEMVGLAGLPEDFDRLWREAVAARDGAATGLADAIAAHALVEDRLDVLPPEDRAIAAATAIADLARRATLVEQQRQDRPNRERERAEGEAQVGALRGRLGLSARDDLEGRLPPEAMVKAVQRLAMEAVERAPQRIAAHDALADATEALASVGRRIEAAVVEGLDASWGIAASEFVGLPGQMANLDSTAAQLLAARSTLVADIADLVGESLGGDRLAALRRLECPDAETLRKEGEAREARRRERERQVERREAAMAEIDSAATEILRLREGGEIATDAALAAARRGRDQAWRPIREAYLAGTPPAAAAARRTQIDALDKTAAAADDLADRRHREAQRLAALHLAEAREGEARAALAAAEAAVARMDGEIKVLETALAKAFPAACALRPALPALRALTEARGALLSREAELVRREEDLALRRNELSPAFERLAAAERLAGVAWDDGAPPSERVRRVTGVLEARDLARADLRRWREEARGLEVEQSRRARILAGIDAEAGSWSTAWAAPLAAIGGEAAMTPVSASELAGQWEAARGVLTGLAQTRRRLLRMDEDAERLAAGVATVAADLAWTAPDDAVAAAQALAERLAAGQKTHAERGVLTPQLAEAKTRLEAAARADDTARAIVHALAPRTAQAGPDEAAGAELARRCGERRAILENLAVVTDQLASAGDGLTAKTLAAQQAGRDLDSLRGELAELKSRQESLDAELETAVRADNAAADALAAFEAGDIAAGAGADREAAIARMHSALERYVDLKIARALVEKAIARVRGERQDPLLRRAGTLFAAATRGAFDGVQAAIDEAGRPVVEGRRAGGGAAAVSAMSEGTRDQLFLAFRLASLEAYARAAEPLPFVADDILVHFDDARGGATLELLADVAVGSATQILLFTHHDSVRDAAEHLAREGRATVALLAR